MQCSVREVISQGALHKSPMTRYTIEVVGGKMLIAAKEAGVVIDPLSVSVTSVSKSTYYGQFVTNFSEINGFTGTPDYVQGQFKTVFGIDLSMSTVKQVDFVFGANATHAVSSVLSATLTE